MSNGTFGNVILAGMSLSANWHGLAIESPDLRSSNANKQSDLANAQSIELVEGHWLNIPPKCKDRSISAEPVVLQREAIASTVSSVHAGLDQNTDMA